MLFYETLKFIRKTSYLTQKQISEKIKIPLGTYSGYETEKHLPTLENFKKIKKFVEKNTEYSAEDLENIYFEEKLKKQK